MSGSLEHAATVLKQGGLVAYATEYCFGLGCDPLNERAVERLLRVKRRPRRAVRKDGAAQVLVGRQKECACRITTVA